MPLWIHAAFHLLIALLPVLVFLGVLILLDSYKLVRPRWVVVLLAAGALAAWASLYVNRLVAVVGGFEVGTITRYWAPVVEEVLKGAVVVYQIVRRRVGFLVDGAIAGFAVGAGFATVENIHYFVHLGEPAVELWLIRGFGTALMHGSVTAIMAILSMQLMDRWGGLGSGANLPGLLLAIALHSVFNHFFVSPSLETLVLLVVLPGFFLAVFRASESHTREWLGTGFDTDAELLEMINSGSVSDTRIGTYLEALKARFPPTTVADMLCLLRLRLELAIRAKGILLMRQSGFEAPPDPEVEERFAELAYLERSIGRTGLRALKPVFSISDRDLWQYHMLGGG